MLRRGAEEVVAQWSPTGKRHGLDVTSLFPKIAGMESETRKGNLSEGSNHASPEAKLD